MPRSIQPDRWLFSSTLVLCLIGQVMVFSASAVVAREQFGSAYAFIGKQFVFLLVGLAGMFWLMNVDYRRLRQPKVVFTSLCVIVLLLVCVFFLDKSHATHRWIRFGPVGIQPSEIAKLVVILYLAWFLETRRSVRSAARPAAPGGAQRTTSRSAEPGKDSAASVNDLMHSLAPALGPVLLIVALVVMQPDLGTAFEIFVV